MKHDWKAAWQPMIDAVGRDFSDGKTIEGADEVCAATIRRYLEPLEFDCALHYDANVAREFGYADIIAPSTAVNSFSLPPLWRPGESVFASDDRNAQPTRSSAGGWAPPIMPPTTGFFAAESEVEYLIPVTVGDRLGRRGAKLVACVPKETRVGRGAFLTWESEICNQFREVVARTRTTSYRYNPHEGER